MASVSKSGYKEKGQWNCQDCLSLIVLVGLCCPRVEIIGTRDWKSSVLAKDLLRDQETTRRYKMLLMMSGDNMPLETEWVC